MERLVSSVHVLDVLDHSFGSGDVVLAWLLD